MSQTPFYRQMGTILRYCKKCGRSFGQPYRMGEGMALKDLCPEHEKEEVNKDEDIVNF